MRLAFLGSPALALPALRALVSAGHEVAMVYARPPRPVGRGRRETPCPVHAEALALGLPVRTPARLRGEAAEPAAFAELGLEAAVVVAYGHLLPRAMLEAPRRGCLNLHFSLLPRHRGAAPVQSAILAGDAGTGVSVMRMDEGLDTGPVLLRESVAIGAEEDAGALAARLAELGAPLLLRALAEDPPAVHQPAEGATHAPKLTKADGALDWREAAEALARRVRAMRPWPGARATLLGEPLGVIAARAEAGRPGAAPGTALDDALLVACGDGAALRLLAVQRPGRAATEAAAFLRGRPVPAGTVLGPG